MSFQNVKTNEDFQFMVNHVVKNCNGGICVVEDIDAIGNFAHERFTKIETTEDDFVKIGFRGKLDKANKVNINKVDTSKVDTSKVDTNTTETMEMGTNDLSLAYFLNLLQGTITPDGLIFIATTNHLDKLDPAFYRDGRFDVKIKMTEADAYQLQKIYNKFIGRSIPEMYMDILVKKKITPATFIFTIKDYICDNEYTDETILSSWL